MKKRLIAALLLSLATAFGAGCTTTPTTTEADTTVVSDTTTADAAADTTTPEETTAEPVTTNAPPETIRIASLKGPTTIGMVKLMSDDDGALYDVSLYGAPDEIVALIAKNEIDIANVPANLAAVLYANTGGAVKVAAINTLGVLYVVESGDTIQSLDDLKGKTLYSTGKGTTPEYALNFVLKQNGIDPDADLTVEYLSESAEVAAKLAADPSAVGVLPQPYIAAASLKNPDLRMAISLTDEWQKAGAELVTGVTIVRTEFLESYPSEVDAFLRKFGDSVDWVVANHTEAAALIGSYDITPEPAALKALPYLNLAFVTNEPLKEKLGGYLGVLFDFNPKSVGGALPDDSFYYISK
ncbi:MAG: ABC transporter substrate-binding protein [Oscillospiraceae bacterium]|jgi:NitT/TauT family transport system substrate-binding protein|nr:ABC transporter substrate-binding protein [Oscillospiraceae bacterium]